MKYKILYTDRGINNTDISDNRLLITIKYKEVLKSIQYIYHYHNHTVTKTINRLAISYFNLYVGQKTIFDKLNLNVSNPFHVDPLEAFIYAYSSYIVFIDLINNQLMKDLPFTFEVPCTLTDGDAASYQTLNYFLLPLTIMKKITQNLLNYYIDILIYFIKTYSPLFPPGAFIDHSQLTIDTMSGLTDHLLKIKPNSVLDKKVEIDHSPNSVSNTLSDHYKIDHSPNSVSDLYESTSQLSFNHSSFSDITSKSNFSELSFNPIKTF